MQYHQELTSTLLYSSSDLGPPSANQYQPTLTQYHQLVLPYTDSVPPSNKYCCPIMTRHRASSPQKNTVNESSFLVLFWESINDSQLNQKHIETIRQTFIIRALVSIQSGTIDKVTGKIECLRLKYFTLKILISLFG